MTADVAARSRPPILVLAGIVVLAAAVRLWGLDFGLPHTQAHPDETFIIGLSLAMLGGQPPPPYYDYPWFFVWLSMAASLGYFVWGLAAGSFSSLAEMAASYELHWAPFFLLNRLLSALFGTASVLAVYAIGTRLRNRIAGLTAALFLALAHIHSQNSHFGTTDVAMTFFIMLSVALLLRAHATGRPWHFVAAGLAGGIAAATKYNAVVLAVPMMLSQGLLIVDSPGRRLEALGSPRTLLVGVPCALAFLTGIPFVFYDYEGFRLAMDLLAGSMAAGSPELGLDSGWVHHFTLSLRHGMGVPLLAAGLGGALLLPVRDVRRGMLFLAFPVAYYVIAGRSLNQFFRYVLPVVPFLCVTAGYLVAVVAARLTGDDGEQPRARVRLAALAAALSAAIVAPSAWSVWQFDQIIARTDNRVVVADWVARFVPKGDAIVQSGSHYGHAPINDEVWAMWTWDRGRREFLVAGHPPDRPPEWILLQESPLPSTTQPEIAALLESGDYDFAWRFQALTLGRQDRVYDLQDAFFVPFAGFDGVARPGPNFTLYRRRENLLR